MPHKQIQTTMAQDEFFNVVIAMLVVTILYPLIFLFDGTVNSIKNIGALMKSKS
jgi:hypothetical protein